MKPRFIILITIVAIVSSAVVPALAAQNTTPSTTFKRSITDKDLFDFIWVANPQLSPDGSRVAFTRVNVDEKRTGYETSIWTVATSGNEPPVRMTNGKHDAHPRWSPDGKRIAFVRGGDKDETGKPKPPQIAILSLAGGEAWIITDLPKGAASPVWSPDGKRIAFLTETTLEDIDKAKKTSATSDTKGADAAKSTAPKAAEPESEHESDVHVISRAVYRSNDEGYLDPRRHDHIWVLHRPSPLQKNERFAGAAMTPPRADCCIPAPPVLEFDQDGKLLASWGGPGQGYEWPSTEHGIFVDAKDNVWLAGSGDKDDQVLKFTTQGKFLAQFGHQGKSAGSYAEPRRPRQPVGGFRKQ